MLVGILGRQVSVFVLVPVVVVVMVLVLVLGSAPEGGVNPNLDSRPYPWTVTMIGIQVVVDLDDTAPRRTPKYSL